MSAPKYIMTVPDQYSHGAVLVKRDYSGRHYQEVARGKYNDILDIANRLNEAEGAKSTQPERQAGTPVIYK